MFYFTDKTEDLSPEGGLSASSGGPGKGGARFYGGGGADCNKHQVVRISKGYS